MLPAPSPAKGGGRFNAWVRGAATAQSLKDRSAWSRDASGALTRSRLVAVKARVVKLNPQRGAVRGRQFVSAKAVDAHLRYLERDGVTKDGEKGHVYSAAAQAAPPIPGRRPKPFLHSANFVNDVTYLTRNRM